jgi:hypothetical protein
LHRIKGSKTKYMTTGSPYRISLIDHVPAIVLARHNLKRVYTNTIKGSYALK